MLFLTFMGKLRLMGFDEKVQFDEIVYMVMKK
jgi:hypothetical protein